VNRAGDGAEEEGAGSKPIVVRNAPLQNGDLSGAGTPFGLKEIHLRESMSRSIERNEEMHPERLASGLPNRSSSARRADRPMAAESVVSAPVVVTGSTHPLLSAPSRMIRDMIDNKRLLAHLVNRDLKVTYHGTVIGWGWSLIEPLAYTAVYYLVFHILRGVDDQAFALEILLGVLVYGMFSKTLTGTTNALVTNAALIKQVAFPRSIFLFSIALFQVVKFSLSLLIVPLLMWSFGLLPTSLLPLLLLVPIGVQSLALGLGLAGSVVQARIRDLQHALGIIVSAGFFLSGVFFSMRHVPEGMRSTFALNPMAVYIELARTAVLGRMDVLEWSHVGQAMVMSFSALLFGVIVFSRYESGSVKHL